MASHGLLLVFVLLFFFQQCLCAADPHLPAPDELRGAQPPVRRTFRPQCHMPEDLQLYTLVSHLIFPAASAEFPIDMQKHIFYDFQFFDFDQACALRPLLRDGFFQVIPRNVWRELRRNELLASWDTKLMFLCEANEPYLFALVLRSAMLHLSIDQLLLLYAYLVLSRLDATFTLIFLNHLDLDDSSIWSILQKIPGYAFDWALQNLDLQQVHENLQTDTSSNLFPFYLFCQYKFPERFPLTPKQSGVLQSYAKFVTTGCLPKDWLRRNAFTLVQIQLLNSDETKIKGFILSIRENTYDRAEWVFLLGPYFAQFGCFSTLMKMQAQFPDHLFVTPFVDRLLRKVMRPFEPHFSETLSLFKNFGRVRYALAAVRSDWLLMLSNELNIFLDAIGRKSPTVILFVLLLYKEATVFRCQGCLGFLRVQLQAMGVYVPSISARQLQPISFQDDRLSGCQKLLLMVYSDDWLLTHFSSYFVQIGKMDFLKVLFSCDHQVIGRLKHLHFTINDWYELSAMTESDPKEAFWVALCKTVITPANWQSLGHQHDADSHCTHLFHYFCRNGYVEAFSIVWEAIKQDLKGNEASSLLNQRWLIPQCVRIIEGAT